MYEAAKYFSKEARRTVANGPVFDRVLTSAGREFRHNAYGCCIVGALLNASTCGERFTMPAPAYTREVLGRRGIKPAAGAIPELMRANDRGLLSTPEAVREALGFND